MDHLEARELLELAAVEPGGMDRLVAGDTPTAIALAGHLAGCDACTDEFSRLRRSSAILRAVIATQPPVELRERTLAFVAAIGRPRSAADTVAPSGSAGEGGAVAHVAQATHAARTSPPALQPLPPVRLVEVPPAGGRAVGRLTGRPRAWLAVAAAVVILASGLSAYAVSRLKDESARQTSLELDGVAEVATWTAHLDARPDVRHVVLSAMGSAGNGPEQVGTLIFSPGTRELVVVADGMPDPPAGQEYRCWVDIGGTRQRLGKMYVSGDLAYWTGDAPILANVPAGSVFGVSLADVSGTGGAGPTILSGMLAAT